MPKSFDTAWRIGVSLATLAVSGAGCDKVGIRVRAGERILQNNGEICTVQNDFIARLKSSSPSAGTVVISQVEPRDETEAAKSRRCNTGGLIR